MAQLKDTVVQGTLSATNALISTSIQTNILRVPDSSNSATYGPGTNGQILRSNGTKVYWGVLAETDIPDVYIKKAGGNDGIMTGTFTLHGLKGTADIDYGTTLPLNPVEGQIFFQVSHAGTELKSITFVSGATQNDTLTVYKSGDIVVMNGRIKNTAAIAGNGGTLFTLPADCCPPATVKLIGLSNGTYQSSPFGMEITTGGVVRTNQTSAQIGADTYFYFDSSFCV